MKKKAKLQLHSLNILKNTIYLLLPGITFGCASSTRILEEADPQFPFNQPVTSDPPEIDDPKEAPVAGPSTTLPSGQIPNDIMRLTLIFQWRVQLRRHTNLSGNVYKSQPEIYLILSPTFSKIISLIMHQIGSFYMCFFLVVMQASLPRSLITDTVFIVYRVQSKVDTTHTK